MANLSNTEKEQLILRANEAVDKVAAEFIGSLKERIGDLEKAIHQNQRELVINYSYNLETEAATFGWPRVTRICKWLRKVFSGAYDQKPDAEAILKVINALKLMVADPENPNEERDIALFKELYPEMIKSVSDI